MKKLKLKPLRERVVVITGASSGIGLSAAKQAASAGASVVLSARNERDLAETVEERLFEDQQAPEPMTDRPDNLWSPVDHDGGERGGYQGRVLRRSLYTTAALHPLQTAFLLGFAGAAALGFARFAGMRRADAESRES